MPMLSGNELDSCLMMLIPRGEGLFSRVGTVRAFNLITSNLLRAYRRLGTCIERRR
ncbi:hypothetical protein PoMZ_02031 [Pyricularia oryzae]|uniref:Uncharacterized protein n=1 Tax=Pyricularia oryzae TaxID=318829 RepID=A0A4P7NAC0_PYROR|nr:hypothetical protein PoMZ_02031 [Pyricularia oryzae]